MATFCGLGARQTGASKFFFYDVWNGNTRGRDHNAGAPIAYTFEDLVYILIWMGFDGLKIRCVPNVLAVHRRLFTGGADKLAFHGAHPQIVTAANAGHAVFVQRGLRHFYHADVDIVRAAYAKTHRSYINFPVCVFDEAVQRFGLGIIPATSIFFFN